VFGFGLQLKKFNHKFTKKTVRVNSDPVADTGDSHAPVPFFVTTGGYGIYVDTARYAEFYCGYGKNKNRAPAFDNTVITTAEDLYNKTELREATVMAIEIPAARGVDMYIFEGETITEIVSQYNMLSGGGCDVPEWGLSMFYRCFAGYTGKEVIAQAEYFRKNDVPCGIIGLEPGWQSGSYSCSYVWDEERYPNYREVIQYLTGNGFHVNLWEHAFIGAVSPLYGKMRDLSGDYEVWRGLVPDFALEEARREFAGYHAENFVALGIDGFKLDECDNSDFTHGWSFPNCASFPSGLDGEQYHSLFGTLYMRTILKALGGRPTLSQVRNAGGLAASYPFVLTSDLYGHRDFIRGVVNAGFSGLLWCPEVREGKSEKDLIRRLQTAVFSAVCLINAWYIECAPWLEYGCENEVRELLKIRESLIPMLKKAFLEYKETGKPPIRALVSDYTSDPETYHIDDQYIFCDRLIAAPMTAEEEERRVYLPAGKWRDYWSKEAVKSGWFTVRTDNIPVFEKVLEPV
jgi:alpha-D-xyloside xylohydrolase